MAVVRSPAPTPTGCRPTATTSPCAPRALLAERRGVDEPVHIAIHKEIPVAGGMAGGSADAAGALLACDHLWGLGLPATTCWTTGRRRSAATSRSCSPAATRWAPGAATARPGARPAARYHWVFAVSDDGLSTPAVYAECDRLRGGVRVPEPQPSAPR